MRCLIAMVVVVSAFATACGGSTEGKFGAELFEVSCARCHGSGGEGSIGPPIGTPDANAALNLFDDQITGVIRVGPGAMPGHPGLSDEQVASLVAFIRSLQAGG